jgi:hypothetical protein
MKIAKGETSADDIANFVSRLIPAAVKNVNSIFSPRQLIKSDRILEPLPVDPRKLSSYRTRLGTMLEYALCTQIDAIIEKILA